MSSKRGDEKMRYFIGFLLSIGVVVVAFILILHIFSVFFEEDYTVD